MSTPRRLLASWVTAGALPAERFAAALRVAGVTPGRGAWRSFLHHAFVWLGVTLLAAAAICFVAANWPALGRFARFALVQGAIVAALLVAAGRGLDTLAGRSALFAGAVLVGVLLALVGQVYQTGADTWELFAAWAVAILPWVAVGRQPALWVLWVALLDLAVVLYFRTSVARSLDALELAFISPGASFAAAAITTGALVCWELAAMRRGGWLGVRWVPRTFATAAGIFVTWPVVTDVFRTTADGTVWVVYSAWIIGLYVAYRHWHRDVYILAGGVSSLLVVLAVVMVRWIVPDGDIPGVVFTGFVIAAATAVGGRWLHRLAGAAP